jgi:predicted secreted protein
MMTYVVPVAIALLGAALWAAETPAPAPAAQRDAFSEDRVAQIAEMLGEAPAGLGRPADDRITLRITPEK